MMTKKTTRRIAGDKVEITFHLPKDLALAIKMKAVQESRSYSDIVTEGMEQFMAKEKKKSEIK